MSDIKYVYGNKYKCGQRGHSSRELRMASFSVFLKMRAVTKTVVDPEIVF